jgi:hypothetical protein
MSTSRLVNITRLTKESFKKCIQNKNPDCVVSKYHNNAVLKGTFSKKAVRGKDDIRKYFVKLGKEVEDVKFEKDPIIFKKNDLIFEFGNYIFIRDNGEKIKANYQFVLGMEKKDYKILSHFSSLRV